MSAGAADEISLRWNTEAYQRIRIKPRVLVDVSRLDTRITLFGQEHAFPILLAPVAGQKLAHPDGELATARGAAAADTTMVLSSFSNTSLEDVFAAAKNPPWFQLYTQKDRGFTRELVQRAESTGYRALCLTVDFPLSGVRNREARANVKLPPLPDLQGMKESKGASLLPSGLDIYTPILDPTLTWKTIEWMRSFTQLPILAKGILNPDDAELAIKAGISGIMVSNHGARNLDTIPATIDPCHWLRRKLPVGCLFLWTEESAEARMCLRPWRWVQTQCLSADLMCGDWVEKGKLA